MGCLLFLVVVSNTKHSQPVFLSLPTSCFLIEIWQSERLLTINCHGDFFYMTTGFVYKQYRVIVLKWGQHMTFFHYDVTHTIGLRGNNFTDDVHGGDTSWPKQFQNGGPQAINKTLHIEYRIVCCIETYLIHIYHMRKCSKCNWNRYIEGFCIWNVHFHINRLSPNIAYFILMSWPLMAIYFLL